MTKDLTGKIWTRDEGKCHYCLSLISREEATVDHIIPRSKVESTRQTGLVLACFSCNQRKADIPYEVFLTRSRPPDFLIRKAI